MEIWKKEWIKDGWRNDRMGGMDEGEMDFYLFIFLGIWWNYCLSLY